MSLSFFEVGQTKYLLLMLLSLVAVVFTVAWMLHLVRNRGGFEWPTLYEMAIGFVTDFLDTLGIGSFAVTTSLYRLGKLVDDKLIPGTLNVGHALPTILQALIFINSIDVDATTLWILIAASVLGSYFGATFVVRLSKRSIQLGMGIALFVAASVIIARLVGWIPAGGDEVGLSGWRLIIATTGNFLFGALMPLGIGAYAPIMIMVSLLGMNPKSAFPIMMGSCAFLMPVAAYRFVKTGNYDTGAALGLTLLGLPGVAIAAFIVKELPLLYVNWLVVLVALYTSISLLRSRGKHST